MSYCEITMIYGIRDLNPPSLVLEDMQVRLGKLGIVNLCELRQFEEEAKKYLPPWMFQALYKSGPGAEAWRLKQAEKSFFP
jgi:hypothetical protein